MPRTRLSPRSRQAVRNRNLRRWRQRLADQPAGEPSNSSNSAAAQPRFIPYIATAATTAAIAITTATAAAAPKPADDGASSINLYGDLLLQYNNSGDDSGDDSGSNSYSDDNTYSIGSDNNAPFLDDDDDAAAAAAGYNSERQAAPPTPTKEDATT
jgi:hypothetical protein